MDGYIHIGTIVASFGLNGEVIIRHELGDGLSTGELPVIYIEKNKNNYIPFFVRTLRIKNTSEAYLKLESINTREASRSLLKKKIYLDPKRFQAVIDPGSNLFYLGFTIVDKKEKELGKIAEIIKMPGQLIAKVFEGEKELLIPLSEQTITAVNTEKKTLYVTLPDGLLDIYRT